jgi:hypothetical protein
MTTHGQAAKWMRLQLERLRERAEKAEAEVERLRVGRDKDTERLKQAWSEVVRLRAALRKIAVGKLTVDGGDLGITAARLCGIARAALRGGE